MDRNREIEGSSTPPAWVKRERKPRPEQALDKCAQCGQSFSLPRSASIDAIDTAGLFARCDAPRGTARGPQRPGCCDAQRVVCRLRNAKNAG